MTHSAEDEFLGTGNRRIFWRSWHPETPRGTVVISHGFAEHSGRYEHVAERLVGAGWAVAALDHHGHGRSEGHRALISLRDAVADLDHLVNHVSCAPGFGPPVFLLGHSMGGGIALRYAIAHGERLRGLIVSGPLVEVPGHGAAKVIGRILGRVAPRAGVSRLDPAQVSRDPQVVAAYEADPLIHHGPLPAGTVAEFLNHVSSIRADVAAIRLPTLILHGTADALCALTGSIDIEAGLGSEDVTFNRYDGLFHEVFNEPERDRVLDDVCAWLDREAPPPGGESRAGTPRTEERSTG
jgi:acylglycerol lipase